MATFNYWTKNYKHEYSFDFKGQKYLVHSIVRLTEEGQKYLGAAKREAVLTEAFYNWNNVRCWTYEFRTYSLTTPVKTLSTDTPPDKLIENVIHPATAGYMEREVFGTYAPSYTTGRKVQSKDWEIPEVRTAWLIFLVIFFAVSIFKDWYVKFIIRIVAGWYFGMYRQGYVDAHTVYVHDEDAEMHKKKWEILHGGVK